MRVPAADRNPDHLYRSIEHSFGRLGEVADACARLGLEPGLGEVAKLEPNVKAIAARLQAHLDERP